MMTQAMFLSLFGILALVAFFLAGFWGALAWERIQTCRKQGFKRPSDYWCDRYLIISSCLSIHSVGAVALFGARVADGLIRGDVITAHLVDYLAIPALIGLILMTIAKLAGPGQ